MKRRSQNAGLRDAYCTPSICLVAFGQVTGLLDLLVGQVLRAGGVFGGLAGRGDGFALLRIVMLAVWA